MATLYNGHHCRNCWNVALWIGNDEGLYRAAVDCKRGSLHINKAARQFIAMVGDGARTPDGAKYTFKAVCSALEGLE